MNDLNYSSFQDLIENVILIKRAVLQLSTNIELLYHLVQ